MLLRRVIEDVKNQNWTAVGIDFAIVVVGVFIGIQVANWNDSRQEQKDATDLLVRLENDLKTETAGWQRAIDYYATTRKHGIAALEGFDDPESQTPTEFLVNLYQASQRWNVVSQRGTYDELISSGRIALIRDEETRSRLANHYLRMSSLEMVLNPTFNAIEYRRLVRLYMDHEIQAAIRETCGDRYTTDEANFMYLQLPATCDPAVDADVALLAMTELLSNTAVRRELRFHISVLDGQLAAMQNGVQIGNSTLAHIQSELIISPSR